MCHINDIVSYEHYGTFIYNDNRNFWWWHGKMLGIICNKLSIVQTLLLDMIYTYNMKHLWVLTVIKSVNSYHISPVGLQIISIIFFVDSVLPSCKWERETNILCMGPFGPVQWSVVVTAVSNAYEELMCICFTFLCHEYGRRFFQLGGDICRKYYKDTQILPTVLWNGSDLVQVSLPFSGKNCHCIYRCIS